MEILLALLEKDYYLKMDFFYYFHYDISESSIFPLTYKNNIYFIKNYFINDDLNMIFKLRDILDKFNKDITYMIYETELKLNKKQNNWTIDCLYNLLNSEVSYSSQIIDEIKKFYKKYFNKDIEVNDDNLILTLDTFINLKENDNLKNDFYQVFNEYLHEFNTSITYNIIYEFKKNLNFSDVFISDNSYDYLRKKLYVFFKVIGKDFIKLIDEPINETDDFNLLFIKYNKHFFRTLRMEILDESIDRFTTFIKNEDLVLTLFILCINFNYNSSITNELTVKFKDSENKYINRSINIHKKIQFP